MANIAPTGSRFQNINNLSDLTDFTLKETFKQLSSGLKVNTGKDQSALLALADKYTTDIQSLNRATLNANDGISVTQVADSALADVTAGFHELQELAVQSASGILNDSDRQSLQNQANQIQDQISDLVQNTRFNEISVLATNSPLVLQTGIDTDEQSVVTMEDFTSAFTSIDLTTQAGARDALDTLQTDLDQVSSARSRFGAEQSGLISTINTLESRAFASTATDSRMQSVDMAQSAAALAASSIRAQAGVAIQAQANQSAAQVQSLL